MDPNEAKIDFSIDGVEVEATPGQTIMQAADAAGIYIPRLCAFEGIKPIGSCRVCTVLVNGRPQAACVQPVAPDIVVESDTPEVIEARKNIINMMFVSGNHYCMFCEASGKCELQAMGYRFGILGPKYPHLNPDLDIDASHPDVYIDRNRCIQCGRCVEVSRDIDRKTIFEFVGRSFDRRVAVSAEANLGDTSFAASDKAADVCPVGSIVKKRVGYQTPVGNRKYDKRPIGSDIEAKRANPDT